MVDLEYEIEQLPVLNRKEHVKEILNKIISNIIDLSQKIKCELCQSKFSSVDSLKRHIRKFHEANEKVKRNNNCNICLKSFTTPYKLKRQAEVHDKVKTINVLNILEVCFESVKNKAMKYF